MYKLDIEIDVLPKSLNKALRTHYFKIHTHNHMWDVLINSLCFNKKPPVPLTKAHIKIERHFWRDLDYDGLVGSMKPVVDALVSCGVLKDDSWKTLGVWDVSQTFRPKKDGPLLKITVTDEI